MSLLDDEIKKFVGEQTELGNYDFEYRLRRALIRYHAIQSKELRERVKGLEAQNKRTKKLLDRYSNYFMLTLDGASPEDTARELKLL